MFNIYKLFKLPLKIMKIVETINTNTSSVSCNGKEYPYDHPRVYLEIDKEKGEIHCSYCYKKFILVE